MEKCKDCDKEIDYLGNERCKECHIKWREKVLKCKLCGTPIDWHNYHWHANLCDDCFDAPIK